MPIKIRHLMRIRCYDNRTDRFLEKEKCQMSITKKILSFGITLAIAAAPVAGAGVNVFAAGFDGAGAGLAKDNPVKIEISAAPASASEEEKFWSAMGTDYYYNQFTADEKKVYDALDEFYMYYLLNDVDIDDLYLDISDSPLDFDEANKVRIIFAYSNPQYFFLNLQGDWLFYHHDQVVYGMQIGYYDDFYSGSDRAEAKAKVKSVMKEYISAVSAASRPEEKAKVAHDMMCEKIYYDYGPLDQSIYSSISGVTVCTGYMKLFAAIMNSCGVECSVVENGDHAWNYINFHGFWYYLDVTWDDYSTGYYYRYYSSGTPSEDVGERYAPYMPTSFGYDILEEDFNYTSRYVTVGSTTYFIVNDLETTGRKVVPVYGSTSSLPSSISYGGYTYEVISSSSSSGLKAGWNKSGNDWYYCSSSGVALTGWQKISNVWYYLDPSSGVMKTGWQQIGGKWYYLTPSSGAMVTGWKQIGGKWYYFNDEGVMAEGWKFSGGKYYYLGNDGAMVTGWKAVSGKWYYFNNDGTMATGWKYSGGKYYLLGNDGAMVTGWTQNSGKWYYFNTDGTMATGWKAVSGKWYYLGTDGIMVTGWKQISGKWYYLNSDGSMVTGKKTIGGKTYNFGSDGVWDGK